MLELLSREDTPKVGRDGLRAIVHVNQAHIKHNAKHKTTLPFYTVKVAGKTLYAWHVIKTGPSVLEDHSQDPLSCGARAYDVTYSPLVLLDQNKQPFLGMTFSEAKALYGTAFTSMDDEEQCPLQKAT